MARFRNVSIFIFVCNWLLLTFSLCLVSEKVSENRAIFINLFRRQTKIYHAQTYYSFYLLFCYFFFHNNDDFIIFYFLSYQIELCIFLIFFSSMIGVDRNVMLMF